MLKTILKEQLPLLTLEGLRNFAATQTKHSNKFKALIAGAQEKIDVLMKSGEGLMTGGTRKVGTTTVRTLSVMDQQIQQQVVDQKHQIRKALDAELQALSKELQAGKIVAAEYAERHWSKPRVMNRAISPALNLTDALAQRAAYATMFRLAGKMELASWGQIAIDTGNALLADAVYREVTTRSKDDRPFLPVEFINLVPNDEYNEARKIIQGIFAEADQAQLALERFEGRSGAPSLNRMKMALEGRGETLPGDDIFDEQGGIRDGYLRKVTTQLGAK